MKKTSKIISIILSIFMLMQVMAGAVFANSDVPENLRWITGREVGRNSDEQGWIAWDLVDGCNAYVLFAYKDNEPVETMLIEVDEEYDFGYESINGCMKANGTGSYTVKAAAYNGKWEDFDKYEYDEDIPILGESEMSEAFEYVGEASSNKDDSTKGTVTAPTAKGDGDSAAADNTKSEESTKPADGKTPTVAEGEIECPLAVKVCYDLGIMPNVYENANKFVTYNDFSKVTSELFGSKPRGESNENIKLESVFDTFASGMVGYKSSIETKYFTGINDGVKLDEDAQITHAQLAKVVYNALNGMIKIAEGKIVKDYNGQLVPEIGRKCKSRYAV